MKESTRNIIIFIFPVTTFLRMISMFICESLGYNTAIVEKIFGAIFVILILAAPYIFIQLSKNRIFSSSAYLESNDLSKPGFQVACSSEIDVPPDFDYNRFKNKIADKWLITFSDDENHVLKFKPKWKLFKKVGAAAWLKFDAATGKVRFECFPLTGIQHKDRALFMQKEITECVLPHRLRN